MSEREAADSAGLLLGKVVANRYYLDAVLGTGSAGAVYRAHEAAGRNVAVKILNPQLMASNAAQRFARESEVMLGIQHPHVVDTLAAGKDESLGVLYMAMPLLRGEDLDAVLVRVGALEPTAAVRIAIQAARGIGAAHGVGVVHRDIKPANLFLDREDDQQITVRVCDFGIAKRLASGSGDAALTATGTQLGTPDYVAPEQLRDSKNVDERADVWGLGATLYEMLCGEPPYAHHANVFDIISAILTEEVQPLLERAPWLEPELGSIVHRALRKKPTERFRSMQDFADALRAHSRGGERLMLAELVATVRKPSPSAVIAPVQLASKPSAPSHATKAASSLPTGPSPKAPAPRQASAKASSRSVARARNERATWRSWLVLFCVAFTLAAVVLAWLRGR